MKQDRTPVAYGWEKVFFAWVGNRHFRVWRVDEGSYSRSRNAARKLRSSQKSARDYFGDGAGDGAAAGAVKARQRVLLSAFACEPNYGSEPEVGWRWALQMARFHDVTVLTLPEHRAPIEAELDRLAGTQPLPAFVYFEGGAFSRWLRRVGGHRLQYNYWQRAVRPLVAALHREKPFALMHHVTYAGYRYTTAIWGHGAATLWGPVGGIEAMPLALLPWRYPRPLIFELLRYAWNFLERFPYDALPRRAARSSLALVTMPETQRRFARSGAHCELMPTVGLSRELVNMRLLLVPEGPLELLFVGQIITLKGVDLLIEALAAARSDARLTFIGSGAFAPDAHALVRRMRLTSRTVFTGRLPHLETLQRFADFHVFAFPSLHDSGGFAALEAMANGLPVICLDCGGLTISVDADRGIKVPLGRRREVIAGLAAAIEFYDRNRSAIPEHGARAREFVSTHYDWDRKGEQMAACYQRILTTAETARPA